jgi:hypothetical protein
MRIADSGQFLSCRPLAQNRWNLLRSDGQQNPQLTVEVTYFTTD